MIELSNGIKISELFGEFLLDVSIDLESSCDIANVLYDDFFGCSQEEIEKDKLKKLSYVENYQKIKTLVFCILDFLLKAKKVTEHVDSIDIKNILSVREYKQF